jgi:hypothetical protein
MVVQERTLAYKPNNHNPPPLPPNLSTYTRRERRAVTTVEVSRHERHVSRSTGKAGNTGKELIRKAQRV